MYAEGMGRTAIARALNDKNIPNPTEYKRLQGLKYKGANKKYGNLWKYFAITDMLSNEMYIGTMVQHRTYKSQSSKPVPKERWIRVEGTHEPIIDKELWDKVQQRMKERAKPMCNGETGIFAGKTKCMYCGYTLSSQKNRNFYYLRCPSRHYSDSSCKGAHISRNLLEKAVLFELNSIIDRYFDASSAEKKIILNRDISLKKNALRNEIKTYHQKVDDLKKATVSARIKAIKKAPAAKEELAALQEYMSLLDAESNYKKAIKQAEADLDTKLEKSTLS